MKTLLAICNLKIWWLIAAFGIFIIYNYYQNKSLSLKRTYYEKTDNKSDKGRL